MNLKLMVIFTDYMFIVWERVHNQANYWKEFKLCVNKASHLKWKYEDLGEEVVFLYLEIWIDRQNSQFMHKPRIKRNI